MLKRNNSEDLRRGVYHGRSSWYAAGASRGSPASHPKVALVSGGGLAKTTAQLGVAIGYGASRASAEGRGSTAVTGWQGSSSAGPLGIAITGANGEARAGKGGILIFESTDSFKDSTGFYCDRIRVVVAYVGEEGILPDTWYKLAWDGRVVLSSAIPKEN